MIEAITALEYHRGHTTDRLRRYPFEEAAMQERASLEACHQPFRHGAIPPIADASLDKTKLMGVPLRRERPVGATDPQSGTGTPGAGKRCRRDCRSL